MNEQTSLKKRDETMETLGRTFMGILIGISAICGIWLASGLVVILSN